MPVDETNTAAFGHMRSFIHRLAMAGFDRKAEFRQLGIMARKQTFNEGSMGGYDGQPDCSDSSHRRFAADFTLFGINQSPAHVAG